MGFWKNLRAVWRNPDILDEARASQAALSLARRELDEGRQEQEHMRLQMDQMAVDLNYNKRLADAYRSALFAVSPQITTVKEMKQLYEAIAPHLDPSGFTLHRMAEQFAGITADERPSSREMAGNAGSQQITRYLATAYFHAMDWTVTPGASHEAAALRAVDTSSPEYQTLERQLYEKVLERMGFQDILAPEHEQTTELKLYSPLSGKLNDEEYDNPHLMSGRSLLAFQTTIRQGIEGSRLTEEAERGLMLYYDGPNDVGEKVISFFPTVEEVDGELYGVAVCQIRGTLSPGELEELKEYCRTQYNYAWGEEFAKRPRKTEYGGLYVSFYTDNIESILTKEEIGMDKPPIHTPHKPKEDRGERHGR